MVGETSSATDRCPTSAVTILSSAHGRQRRAERNIQIRDLQAAVKHGTKEAASCHHKGVIRWKYTFGDVVFITDETSRHEITSWALPGCGIDIEVETITPAMWRSHDAANVRIKFNHSSWTSHTVVVVDQSGSMRKNDVADGITRSDAVWLTLAMDFVHGQLVSGQAKDTDVVSVVGMNAGSTILLDRQPMDWVLFNNLVNLLRTAEPQFEGNYIPAMQAAEDLLMSNTTGSCALQLLFLSDGKPSDHIRLPRSTLSKSEATRAQHVGITSERIQALASRFGRRLSVHTIGFAGAGEDFSVLKTMSTCTADFGSLGSFQSPSMTAASLGFAISSITSTLTSTKTELTELGGTSQRTVRDVRREARCSASNDLHLSSEWTYFDGNIAEISRYEFSPRESRWLTVPAISDWAKGVAMHKFIFGEGAERMVSRFREVGPGERFVGPLLVAKESRFIEDIQESYKDQKKFHEMFCRTQIKAQDIARDFNKKLAMIPGVTMSTPRIEFLDCCVVEIKLPGTPPFAILVEEMIDKQRYRKFNSNNGYVDGQKQNEAQFEQEQRAQQVDPLVKQLVNLALGALIEVSDEEGDNDEHEEHTADAPAAIHQALAISPSDIPQAFSHFTYRYTRRKMMVCDLQGVLEERGSALIYRLTDPVIHYASKRRQNVFGRTDRGRKGMQNFLKTHKCSDLCRALSRTWFPRNTAAKDSAKGASVTSN